MLPRILICGGLRWVHKELAEFFDGKAEMIHMDSLDRAAFFAELQPGGKYAGIVGVYRRNISSAAIGPFDSTLIDALAPSVKWIAHNGAGYDQIDVLHCKTKGISVSNTPGAVDDSTATTALYLLIAALRQFPRGERSLRAGAWKPDGIAASAHDPTGRTLAILGLGGIGMRFAELVHAFPMRILYHSRRRVVDAPPWCEYVPDVGTMLAQADVLSVHVPLRADTAGLVGEAWIRRLPRGAILINTARGGVVDEEAMIRALEDGHLAAAGLDVFAGEPNVNPRLLEMPQLVLLPHLGTSTQDAQRKMEVRALANLRDFLETGQGRDLVPELRP